MPLIPLAVAAVAGLRLAARGVDLGMPGTLLAALSLPAIALAILLTWGLVARALSA